MSKILAFDGSSRIVRMPKAAKSRVMFLTSTVMQRHASSAINNPISYPSNEANTDLTVAGLFLKLVVAFAYVSWYDENRNVLETSVLHEHSRSTFISFPQVSRLERFFKITPAFLHLRKEVILANTNIFLKCSSQAHYEKAGNQPRCTVKASSRNDIANNGRARLFCTPPLVCEGSNCCPFDSRARTKQFAWAGKATDPSSSSSRANFAA